MKTEALIQIEEMRAQVKAFYGELDTWEPKARARALRCFSAYLAETCEYEPPCIVCQMDGVELILEQGEGGL
jgi:hypothetical protein